MAGRGGLTSLQNRVCSDVITLLSFVEAVSRVIRCRYNHATLKLRCLHSLGSVAFHDTISILSRRLSAVALIMSRTCIPSSIIRLHGGWMGHIGLALRVGLYIVAEYPSPAYPPPSHITPHPLHSILARYAILSLSNQVPFRLVYCTSRGVQWPEPVAAEVTVRIFVYYGTSRRAT